MKLAILETRGSVSIVGNDQDGIGYMDTQLIWGKEDLPVTHVKSLVPEIRLPVVTEINWYSKEEPEIRPPTHIDRKIEFHSRLVSDWDVPWGPLYIWAVFDRDTERWFVWHKGD